VVREQASFTYRLLEGGLSDLKQGGKDTFEAVFSTRLNTWHSYDKYYSLKIPRLDKSKWKEVVKSGAVQEQLCDLPWFLFCLRRAEWIFENALIKTKRAIRLRLLIDKHEIHKWKLNEIPQPGSLVVCLELDRSECFREIDKGPSAEDATAAAAFRDFWGPKAELRRFRDGSILETLDWRQSEVKESKRPRRGDQTVSDRETSICDHIVDYAVTRFWPFDVALPLGRSLEKMLFVLDSEHQRRTGSAICRNPFQSLLRASDDLLKRMRDLDLPLAIAGFSAADPALRRASLVCPSQHPFAFGRNDPGGVELFEEMKESKLRKKSDSTSSSKRMLSKILPCVNVVLELESSGKWPDDVEAIRMMKTAFHVQIAEKLEAEFPGQQRIIPAAECLNVLFKGYAFCFSIRLDKERALLRNPRTSFLHSISTAAARKIRTESGGTRFSRRYVKDDNKPTALALAQATELERSTVRAPKLHRQLDAIHGSGEEFGGANVLGPVTRLAKLWISGHYLWSHISEEAVELLTASLFLHPHPYKAPRSPMCGFIRFLALLATWDWESEPLFVNFAILNENAGSEGKYNTSLMKSFVAARERGSGPYMFLVTPDDYLEHEGEWKPFWASRSMPDEEALQKMTRLARDSLRLIETLLAKQASGDTCLGGSVWAAVFKSLATSEEFDAIIQLEPSKVLQIRSAPKKTFKNLIAEEDVLVGINPVEKLFEELQLEFQSIARLSFDPFRGQSFGLRWRGGAMDPVPLKIAVAAHTMPSGDGLVRVDKEDVRAEIMLIGGDLIEKIEMKNT